MSRFVGDCLTESLVVRLSIEKAVAAANGAVVICTVDDQGWAHPAMLSSLEIVAIDSRNVRMAINSRSRTARNMQANGHLTLVLVAEGTAHYVKGDVRLLSPSLATAPGSSKYNLRVDSVLEDAAADYEQAHIVSGILVKRDTLDPEHAMAVLRELSSG